MDFLTTELVFGFLSDTAKASLTEKLIIVAAVWWMIRKVVNKHFDQMNQGLNNVANNVKDLTEVVAKDFKAHDARLHELEGSVSRLTNRIDKIEENRS